MPTYDYKCLECGDSFEVFQNITEEPLQICTKCKGQLKRMIGPGAGPIFKGSGFYQTDYKSSGKSEKKESKSTEQKSDSGSSSPKETKNNIKSSD